MKKFLFAISFVFYFVVSSGFVINAHYCMKKLQSVHLFGNKATSCNKCGMEMHDNNSCCHDEQRLIKLTQDQQAHSIASYDLDVPVMTLFRPSDFLLMPEVRGISLRYKNDHPPPLLADQEIYLRNRVFRI